MQRRHFVTLSAMSLAGCTLGAASPRTTPASTAARFHAARRVVTTRFGAISCADRGTGDAALFLHGYPLNAFQWRGALERLSPYRRCIAPDLMGLGYTQTHADQDLSPQAQTDMIVALLDALAIKSVDVVANDSGGTIAQLFAVQNPARIRTLLLTNCDVHENSPPAGLRPFIETARAGRAADEFLAPQLADKDHARSPQGLGGLAYTDPANLTDECIQYYFEPLLSSTLRKAQFNGYAVAFDPNPLLAIEPLLRRCQAPLRVVWGTGDVLFDVSWAHWLDRTLPESRGIRFVEGAKLFFPEEMPELIAQEALALWSGAARVTSSMR